VFGVLRLKNDAFAMTNSKGTPLYALEEHFNHPFQYQYELYKLPSPRRKKSRASVTFSGRTVQSVAVEVPPCEAPVTVTANLLSNSFQLQSGGETIATFTQSLAQAWTDESYTLQVEAHQDVVFLTALVLAVVKMRGEARRAANEKARAKRRRRRRRRR